MGALAPEAMGNNISASLDMEVFSLLRYRHFLGHSYSVFVVTVAFVKSACIHGAV
jgi:hypothetical protein